VYLGWSEDWVAYATVNLHIIRYEGGDMQAMISNLYSNASSVPCITWVTNDQRTGPRYPGSQKPTAFYLGEHRLDVRSIVVYVLHLPVLLFKY